MPAFRWSKKGNVSLAASAGLLLASSAAGSAFNTSNSLAVYWGQNSYNQATGPLAQQPLATYCANTNIDIIPMAFMVQITTGTGGQPVINFANQGNDCTVFPGTQLLNCPHIEQDIKTCQQKYGKTILLSIGGATYTEGGFASSSAAEAAAQLVWRTFGPTSSTARKDRTVLNATLSSVSAAPPGNSSTSITSKNPLFTNPTALSTTGLAGNFTATPLPKWTNLTSHGSALLTTIVQTVTVTAGNAVVQDVSSATNSVQRSTSPSSTVTTTMSATTVPYDVTHPVQQRQSSTLRPFGDAVIDGFDLDLESANQNFKPFASKLRQLMDADKSKKYYLTAAPQCPYPDAADDSMLNGGVPFDGVFVQFYNNYCGLQSFVAGASTQNNFNFDTWNNWAKNSSANPDVKIFLGVPAGQTAAGSGYTNLAGLKPIIKYCKTFSNFGGVMAWDVSQAYSHPGFLRGIKNTLKQKPTARRTVARKWAA